MKSLYVALIIFLKKTTNMQKDNFVMTSVHPPTTNEIRMFLLLYCMCPVKKPRKIKYLTCFMVNTQGHTARQTFLILDQTILSCGEQAWAP